jgi:hypothetical protein
VPQVEVRSRLRVSAEALLPPEAAPGWTVLATTRRSEACTEVEMRQAYQAQQSTVEPGFRWIKHPAAISPVWREKPARLAALARLTGVGFLVSAVIQRQVRLSLRDHDRHIPGHTGATAIPTAAVVCALCTPVTLVHFAMDHAPILHVQGIQEDQLIVCEAVGIDHAWYQGEAAGQHSRPSTTPP